jgi:hypoxanthine phosphoribosyltransferase
VTVAREAGKVPVMNEHGTARLASGRIGVVRLAELPPLADALAGRVRAAGFVPDMIVYVEKGARLLAHELAERLGVPARPIWVQRGGHGLKRRLAPLVLRLPVGVRDWLRRVEELSGVHRLTRRTATMPGGNDLRGRRVLIVDDAADTGRTIEAARAMVLARGALSEDVRTAVIAATTQSAQVRVDFCLFDRNCRMPWSTDSDERAEAEARADQLAPRRCT